jgi:hypothetical protein
MDMTSVFTDDDVSVHTNLSTVEVCLIELQNANVKQNKIIAQQNAKIESMIESLSAMQDRNTTHITDVMRDTMREYMEAQMKAIIAEVGKTQISTPKNVDINTQTTVSTTTNPNSLSPATDIEQNKTPDNGQNGMEIEYSCDTAPNSAKRTMTHTPDVSPVKGSTSIAPLRKLPVPPSRKLSYPTGLHEPPPPSTKNCQAIAASPSDPETPATGNSPNDPEPHAPGEPSSPGQCL